jgi:hypothetical protein
MPEPLKVFNNFTNTLVQLVRRLKRPEILPYPTHAPFAETYLIKYLAQAPLGAKLKPEQQRCCKMLGE